MRHRATREFWTFFERLPDEIQELARKNFKLLNDDPAHPSLHFKYAGAGWSVDSRYPDFVILNNVKNLYRRPGFSPRRAYG